jgi:predicted transcriptional regulator
MSTTSFRLDDDLQEKLDTAANRLQRSKGWIINDALRQYIEQEERKQKTLEDS